MKPMVVRPLEDSIDLKIDIAKTEPVWLTKEDKLHGVFLPMDFIQKMPELNTFLQKYVDQSEKVSLQITLNGLLPSYSFDSDAEAERYIEELRFFQSAQVEHEYFA